MTVLLLCASCGYMPRVDDMAFVLAIGVDEGKGQEGGYEYTFSFVKPDAYAKGAQKQVKPEKEGMSKSGALSNLTIKAPTVFDALEVINLSMAKNPDLSHAKLIVISKDVAKQGLKDELDAFMGYNGFSANLYIAIATDSAAEYLANINSPLQDNPSRYYDMVFNSNMSPYLPNVFLKDFYIATRMPDKEAVLPLVGVSDVEEKDKLKDGFRADSSNRYDVQPPSDSTYSEVNSEALGMAVFEGDTLQYTMTAHDAFLYHVLSGTLRPSFYIKQNAFALTLRQQRTPQITVMMEQGAPMIRADVALSADVITADGALSETDIADLVSDALRSELNALMQRVVDQGSDILGFGEHMRLRYMTLSAWNDFDWRDAFKRSAYAVDVNVQVNRPSRQIPETRESQ